MAITETYQSKIAQWNLISFEEQALYPHVITQVYLEAIDSLKGLHKRRLDILLPLTSALSKFNFTLLQRKTIYQLLSGAELDSLQMGRFLDSRTPFTDFAELWTLRLSDEDVVQSKAELCTFGQFFKSFFNCRLDQNSRVIDLREIPFRIEEENYFTSFYKWLTSQDSGIIESLEINKETFEAIISFLKGKVFLIADQDTVEVVKHISRYLHDSDLEQMTSTSIDDAIMCVAKYQLGKIDLAKFNGKLTHLQFSQILNLQSLRQNGQAFDLTALFPRLDILDGSAWKNLFNMNTHELNVDSPIDLHAAIDNLHEMFRTLDKNTKITLLTMPQGLTLNKLILLARSKWIEPNIGHAIQIYGDIPIKTGYSVAITHRVINGTRDIGADMQKKFIMEAGFALPRLLEALTFHLFNKARYLDADLIRFRVEETIGHHGTWYLIVGSDLHVWQCLNVTNGAPGVRRF